MPLLQFPNVINSAEEIQARIIAEEAQRKAQENERNLREKNEKELAVLKAKVQELETIIAQSKSNGEKGKEHLWNDLPSYWHGHKVHIYAFGVDEEMPEQPLGVCGTRYGPHWGFVPRPMDELKMEKRTFRLEKTDVNDASSPWRIWVDWEKDSCIWFAWRTATGIYSRPIEGERQAENEDNLFNISRAGSGAYRFVVQSILFFGVHLIPG